MDYDLAENTHVKPLLASSQYGGIYTQNPELSPLGLAHAYGTFDVNQKSAELRFTGTLVRHAARLGRRRVLPEGG